MSNEKAKKPHNYSVGKDAKKEKKPRIYLSGPITGIPNYKKDFELVRLDLEGMGYKNIVNPAELDEVITNGSYEEYMKICLALLDMCDMVVLLPGWEKSAGANREYGYAIARNKAVLEWKDVSVSKGEDN